MTLRYWHQTCLFQKLSSIITLPSWKVNALLFTVRETLWFQAKIELLSDSYKIWTMWKVVFSQTQMSNFLSRTPEHTYVNVSIFFFIRLNPCPGHLENSTKYSLNKSLSPSFCPIHSYNSRTCQPLATPVQTWNSGNCRWNDDIWNDRRRCRFSVRLISFLPIRWRLEALSRWAALKRCRNAYYRRWRSQLEGNDGGTYFRLGRNQQMIASYSGRNHGGNCGGKYDSRVTFDYILWKKISMSRKQ